jgi:phosphate acetyltransferase
MRRGRYLAGNLYISSIEPQSGKSIVSLGLMEMLSSRVERLGFFRPIVESGPEPDPQIELIRTRYQLDSPYEDMYALSVADATALIAAGDHDEVAKRVVHAYKQLERGRDFVVCEGTDFGGSTHMLDLDLNAELANALGAPVLVVVNGGSPGDVDGVVRVARDSFAHKGCALFGIVVNRVPEKRVAEVAARVAKRNGDEPVYVMAEREELSWPTVGDVAETLGGGMLFHSPETLQREVRDVRVAAMSVEHFVEGLTEGTLVIVPPDRTDILIACLASTVAPDFPSVAGIVLTVGTKVESTVLQLLRDAPFPVLRVAAPTYVAANAVHSVRPLIAAYDERKIASALGLFESAIDTAGLAERVTVPRPTRMTPVMFEYELIERAKASRRHVVLPEGDDDRILRAADILLRRQVVDLTLLGDPDKVRARAASLGLDIGAADVVDPVASPARGAFADRYHDLRKHKGITQDAALDRVSDPSYFGTMMVQDGAADGMVSGAAHTTGDTIRPAFEIVKARPGVSVVSSVFFMCLPDRVLVYGDCAVNPQPDEGQLADIAISSADTAATFGVEPRIAMLSYSTGSSGAGADVDSVRAATALVRERRPDLMVEGPIQYDAAVDPEVARSKLPGSEVAGRATVLIFPDLESGNVAYKAVLQGLRRPVNDLSRGCHVTDIVNTVAITAIQAQEDGR